MRPLVLSSTQSHLLLLLSETLSISQNEGTSLALILGCAVGLFSVCLISLAALGILQGKELCHLSCMHRPCAQLSAWLSWCPVTLVTLIQLPNE